MEIEPPGNAGGSFYAYSRLGETVSPRVRTRAYPDSVSLIDELRSFAEKLPPSHIPSAAELPAIVGGLLARVEHGAEIIDADADAVAEALGSPTEREREAAETDPAVAVPQRPPVSGTASEPASATTTGGAPLATQAAPVSQTPGEAPQDAPTVAELQAELASVRQQLATQQAVENRTTPAPVEEPPPGH